MNKLKNNTFYTIFIIMSLFITLVTIWTNVLFYQRSYLDIKQNLIKINQFIYKDSFNKPFYNRNIPDDLNNRFVMDYDVYTFILDNRNQISNIISHNGEKINNDIINNADKIISKEKEDKIIIKCLYFNSFAYKYKVGAYLTIIDISNIQSNLLSSLLISLLVLITAEIIIYLLSMKITKWITKPVEDSFNKQKEFIANASHELKTPLSIIIASSDCITSDDKNEKWLDNIKYESDRMNNLIKKLLLLSKSEDGLKQEELEEINISKLINKKILSFDSIAFENNVSIVSDITDNINYYCCKNDIDQLVGIILDNAIKHSYKKTNIHVSLFEEKDFIYIAISNHGKEIKSDDYDKIFERFYRGDKSRERKSNRYGLGLSIAKNIVDNYHGDISVISEDEITTFTIKFKKKH